MLALVLSLATGQWSLVGSKTTKMAQHTSEWSVYLCTARSSLFGGFPLVQSILRAKLLPLEETTASSLGRFTVPQLCGMAEWSILQVLRLGRFNSYRQTIQEGSVYP